MVQPTIQQKCHHKCRKTVFLKFIDKHFPKGSKLHKIFNRNSVSLKKEKTTLKKPTLTRAKVVKIVVSYFNIWYYIYKYRIYIYIYIYIYNL